MCIYVHTSSSTVARRVLRHVGQHYAGFTHEEHAGVQHPDFRKHPAVSSSTQLKEIYTLKIDKTSITTQRPTSQQPYRQPDSQDEKSIPKRRPCRAAPVDNTAPVTPPINIPRSKNNESLASGTGTKT